MSNSIICGRTTAGRDPLGDFFVGTESTSGGFCPPYLLSIIYELFKLTNKELIAILFKTFKLFLI
jgi:hypothetical protein